MRRAFFVILVLAMTDLVHATSELRDVDRRQLCVTLGAVRATATGLEVDSPKMRAVLAAKTEARAELEFTYVGPTRETAPLASGQVRRQIGLKLRALDGCNLVYVMVRIEPKPGLVVSIKRNPGMRTHAECGAHGYTNVKPLRAMAAPSVKAGDHHVLAAAIEGHRLTVSLDGATAWQGELGPVIDEFDGPVGVRSDNGIFRFRLRAPVQRVAGATCAASGGQSDDD